MATTIITLWCIVIFLMCIIVIFAFFGFHGVFHRVIQHNRGDVNNINVFNANRDTLMQRVRKQTVLTTPLLLLLPSSDANTVIDSNATRAWEARFGTGEVIYNFENDNLDWLPPMNTSDISQRIKANWRQKLGTMLADANIPQEIGQDMLIHLMNELESGFTAFVNGVSGPNFHIDETTNLDTERNLLQQGQQQYIEKKGAPIMEKLAAEWKKVTEITTILQDMYWVQNKQEIWNKVKTFAANHNVREHDPDFSVLIQVYKQSVRNRTNDEVYPQIVALFEATMSNI